MSTVLSKRCVHTARAKIPPPPVTPAAKVDCQPFAHNLFLSNTAQRKPHQLNLPRNC